MIRTDAELPPTLHSDEPILAWRTWALRIRGNDLSLEPVAGRGRAWPARKPVRSHCRHSRLHTSPNLHCSCGLHGARDLDLLRKTRTPGVLSRVALWGRVIEHELGFRASLGYPQRLLDTYAVELLPVPLGHGGFRRGERVVGGPITGSASP